MRSLAFTSAVLLALGVGSSAHAGELCTKGALYRGPALDLDVKDADVHDVMRLLSDVGRVNVVVADDVRGKVTLKLRRVAWQQIACTIAALHRLSITVDGNILLVRRRD